ncbi:SNF2-related protein [Haloferula chungangensis]|uniref:SNF2-related protein n=1 Tax=Haloferula chungangensis TaxID=1048331 RepID=A0ABW2L7R2_9BACT
MNETLERIAERPALLEWLTSSRWEEHFDFATLTRSQDFTKAGCVSNVEWIDLGGSGEITITSFVGSPGGVRYLTTNILSESRGKWMLESDCTCPVSQECKHAAATFRVIQNRLSGQPAPTRLVQDELPFSNAPTASKEQSPRKSTFLAYCIERPQSALSPGFQFVLRTGKHLSDGRVRIMSGVASVSPDKPTECMSDDDIELVREFEKRQFDQQTFGTMPLEGADWSILLEAALTTGRLYFGKEPNDHRGTTEHRVLAQGEPATIDADWESLADGSARPVTRASRSGLELLPLFPPRYLDPKAGTIGLVKTNVPPDLLATWTRGPVVKPDAIPALVARLSRYPGAKLPAPKQIESITRPAVAPTPVLSIRRISVGASWERSHRFIGELFFQYGDSPRLAPLTSSAPRQHSANVEGKRIIWPRDFKAERTAEAELLKLPLTPFGKAPNPNALVPSHQKPSHEMAWLKLLDSTGFRQLRAEGWIIEIDKRAGLTARNASSFIPAMEADPEHGIDWFRFDISYEIDGKRFSLIPFIAQAIEQDLPPADSPDLPEHILLPCENPEDGFIRFPARQLMETVDRVRHLFEGNLTTRILRLDRLSAASIADELEIDDTDTSRTLARLGQGLRDIHQLPAVEVPNSIDAKLRDYQKEGFRWLQFLAAQGLHGILADDMGLGKTLQTLTHLTAEQAKGPGRPSLIVAPTSVVPNWSAEVRKFAPHLNLLVLHGPGRRQLFRDIPDADLVLTSFPLLGRDIEELASHDWHVVVLDEAQHIKNPKSINARSACKLKATQRLCLSGTPMENHLGELWSLMRFLMPGFLGTEKAFNTQFRKPIESDQSKDVQLALNKRVASLILRRTKDQVASELPEKTEIIHRIDLNKPQTQLYESVRASMDKRVREAIDEKGLGQSHILALSALMKLRQICCHPQLLEGSPEGTSSAKLDFLTEDLLPTLIEEGRRILIFSQFTSMLALIQEHLEEATIPFLKLTGQSKNRGELVEKFQLGEIPVFLISLKAGGTGLNLTAADTVIHYDPWWNPAAENQATDRAHRIGQRKPVFVHKLICQGSIEDRILDLQNRKSNLVEALLSEETTGLNLDQETLGHLLAPL